MKIKTIQKLLTAKHAEWRKSITDGNVSTLVQENSIITGGAIASMLAGEQVNDYDVYFTNMETAKAVAGYYLTQFVQLNPQHENALQVDAADGRVRIITNKNGDGRKSFVDRGETVGEPGAIEDTFQETKQVALDTEDEGGKPKYRPLFMTTNAITLSNRVQLVLRFYGKADEIHTNYDFVHCTNFWESSTGKLTLRQAALESLISRELRYVGSKYPVCSVIRLRKFLARQWTINAGQILKMLFQINELDLTDPKVLEDQLTGVDLAYFCQLIAKLKEKDPAKVDGAYLVEIIDRIF